MESRLLESTLGIKGFDPGYLVIALAVLVIAVAALIVLTLLKDKKIKSLESRIDALCTGASGESLEGELAKIIEENQYLMTEVSEHKSYIKTIFRRFQIAYQKSALVKYDALDQMGGKLSFVLCMLDENNNGFLINSVHTSTMNYIYSKTVESGEVEVELGTEEAEALEKAKAVKIPR